MNELTKELTADMLPEGIYREIAEAIGTDNLIRLAEIVGGSTFYLPKPESLIRPVRDIHIKTELYRVQPSGACPKIWGYGKVGASALRGGASRGAAKHVRITILRTTANRCFRAFALT